MSWNNMRKTKEGSSLFIRLKDGDSIEGMFAGEPHTYYSKFKDKPEYTAWADGRSFKFRLNFITKNDDNELEAKILTGGSTISNAILDMKEEYGLDCIFKIKRTGSGKDDTRYTILFKDKLKDGELAVYKSVKLNQLTKSNIIDYDERNPPPSDEEPFV